MNTITAADWSRYRDKLAAINTKAADEFVRHFVTEGGGYANFDKDVIVTYAYALATKYGEASAALACDMYDALATIEHAHVKAAEPAATATLAETTKAIYGTLGTDEMPRAVSRLVKQAGADTMLKNAKRDRAEFAWIPSGDSCAFCAAIASRGWQPATNKTIQGDHAEHIHANCQCEFAIRFTHDMDVAGYEPEKLREEYDSAEGDTPQEKIDSMRRVRDEEKRKEEGQREIESALEKQLRNMTGSSTLTDAIVKNHGALSLYTPEGMKDKLEETGYEVKPLGRGGLKGVAFKDGGGYRINYGGDGIFQYHPEKGSHHGGAYWKVKNGEKEARYDMDGNIKQQ